MEEKTVLSRNGIVEVLYFPFQSRVRFDSPNEDLDDEWNLIESWIKADQQDNAPEEVSGFFFSSHDFWCKYRTSEPPSSLFSFDAHLSSLP